MPRIPIQIDVTNRKDKVTVTASFHAEIKLTGPSDNAPKLCEDAANALSMKFLTDYPNAIQRILNTNPDLPVPVRTELAKLTEIPTYTLADLKFGPTITKHLSKDEQGN